MIADKALWVIERNSDQPLTLNGLAEACEVSRSHLASAFASATGVPVMKYLRARRLSEAARTLAGGAPDILSVALSSGYGSHEAFTRAFRDQFGMTPEAVRERGGVGGLAITAPLELKPRAFPRLATPRLERGAVLRAVGLKASRTYGDLIEIPAQWQGFVERMDEISDVVEAMPIGLCFPTGEDGLFDYVCAVEVIRFGSLPAGLTKVEVPAADYAVFQHPGHVSTIFDTYSAIWNEGLPALGRTLGDGPVIERHNDAFDPETGEGGLELWAPVS